MPEVSERIYFVLATILIIASGIGIVASLFSQPLILAYIVSGALVGAISSNLVVIPTPVETFGFFSQIGIALILFMVGIELSIADIKTIGKPVFMATFFHSIVIGGASFLIAIAFGYSALISLYIALAITFSSTVVVVKLLDQQKDVNSLYGKLTIGILLLQDLMAVVILIVLSGLSPKGVDFNIWTLVQTIIKGAGFIAFIYFLTKFILGKIFAYVANSQELLFLCAIAWALGISSFSKYLGFSFEIGAFLGGIALANFPYRYAISARISAIRDFFIIIFFIVLGLSIDFKAVSAMIGAIVVFGAFVLIATPIVVSNYLGFLGFNRRTAFLSGLSLAQVSEFSLILVVVGKNLGHLDSNVISLISSVAILTIAASSYLITNGSKIYKLVGNRVTFLENKKIHIENSKKVFQNHFILVGCEQMGADILKYLKSKIEDREKIVVVDFNPTIVNSLSAEGTQVLFGDIADPEILDQLNVSESKLIITTVPDVVDSTNLIKFAKGKGFEGPIICSSYWLHDAIKLYEVGADYVVVPETVGGKHLSRVLSENWDHLGHIKKERSKHFEDLVSRKIF